MISRDGYQFIFELGMAAEAQEACLFACTSGGTELGVVLLHHRPDDAPNNVRAAALAAFRELAGPCLRQDEDRAIELGGSTDIDGRQYCLVLRRKKGQVTSEVAAFICTCADRAEAQARLQQLGAILSAV